MLFKLLLTLTVAAAWFCALDFQVSDDLLSIGNIWSTVALMLVLASALRFVLVTQSIMCLPVFGAGALALFVPFGSDGSMIVLAVLALLTFWALTELLEPVVLRLVPTTSAHRPATQDSRSDTEDTNVNFLRLIRSQRG